MLTKKNFIKDTFEKKSILYSPHKRQNCTNAVHANSLVNVASISCWIDSRVCIFDDEGSSTESETSIIQNDFNSFYLPSIYGAVNKL
jgi:hypothetical protein